tara:strand:+ start:157 stop:549 length:393 start_codon:yes stop_codon:yes gene_type:complete
MTDAYILQAASRDELKHHWEDVVGMAPPSRISHSTMADILICEAQWKASGQSKAAVMRKLKHGVSAGDSNKPVANSGARLVREWNGREHVVDVTVDGYVWNGRTWRSLSAIAKEITGAKWSGPRFFGVAA